MKKNINNKIILFNVIVFYLLSIIVVFWAGFSLSEFQKQSFMLHSDMDQKWSLRESTYRNVLLYHKTPDRKLRKHIVDNNSKMLDSLEGRIFNMFYQTTWKDAEGDREWGSTSTWDTFSIFCENPELTIYVLMTIMQEFDLHEEEMDACEEIESAKEKICRILFQLGYFSPLAREQLQLLAKSQDENIRQVAQWKCEELERSNLQKDASAYRETKQKKFLSSIYHNYLALIYHSPYTRCNELYKPIKYVDLGEKDRESITIEESQCVEYYNCSDSKDKLRIHYSPNRIESVKWIYVDDPKEAQYLETW